MVSDTSYWVRTSIARNSNMFRLRSAKESTWNPALMNSGFGTPKAPIPALGYLDHSKHYWLRVWCWRSEAPIPTRGYVGHSERHGSLIFTGCSLKFIFVTGEGRHGIGESVYSETKESSRGLVKEGTGVEGAL